MQAIDLRFVRFYERAEISFESRRTEGVERLNPIPQAAEKHPSVSLALGQSVDREVFHLMVGV